MQEHRQHTRYHLRWDIALVSGAATQPLTLRGRTNDLSLGGASVLIADNPQLSGQLSVLLVPPPLQAGQAPRLIEADARVVYSILSANACCFRVGLQFVRFKDDGRMLLEQRLAHHMPAFSVGRAAQPVS